MNSHAGSRGQATGRQRSSADVIHQASTVIPHHPVVIPWLEHGTQENRISHHHVAIHHSSVIPRHPAVIPWLNHGIQKNKINASLVTGRQQRNLLLRIHNAAMHNLHVPPQAAWLNQHGDVQLKFVLLPTGQVTQVQIVTSSGYHLLDQAAQLSLKTLPIVSPLNLSAPLSLSLRIQFQ